MRKESFFSLVLHSLVLVFSLKCKRSVKEGPKVFGILARFEVGDL